MSLIQTNAPHIHHKDTTQKLMLNVIIALLPCVIAGIVFYGMRAAITIIVSVASAVLAELLWQLITRKKVTVGDMSAVLTGLLLALCISPSVPWWIPVVGSFFAIIVVKQLFGGLGDNFLNPALTARALLLACWPAAMTTFIECDAVTAATPLHTGSASIMQLLTGNVAGSVGETCKIAILIGFIFLLVTKTITWHIPVLTVVSAALMGWILGMNPLTTVLSGGLLFGAVFMATDYVTCPMKRSAQSIYAVLIGVITVLIRKFTNFPEGVTYAILIMNIAAPLIENWMPDRVYGYGEKK